MAKLGFRVAWPVDRLPQLKLRSQKGNLGQWLMAQGWLRGVWAPTVGGGELGGAWRRSWGQVRAPSHPSAMSQEPFTITNRIIR